MIITLTAHPALDRTLTLGTALRPGEVHTALTDRTDVGGKGINVSRAVLAAGLATRAVVPVAQGDPLIELLSRVQVPLVPVNVNGNTRTNLTVVDPDGVTTKLNTPGATLDAAAESQLIRALIDNSHGARWLVLAGSLPPGADAELYVRIIHAIRAAHPAGRGPAIAVDTSGEALTAVVAEAHPDLIKPNDEEITALAGSAASAPGPTSPISTEHAIDVARQLVPGRVGSVLLTLGSAGAVLVTADEVVRATAPTITVASTVGAGDSSLAGYLIAHSAGASAAERLRTAVSYGAAAATLPGTQPPTPDTLPAWDIPVTPIA